jgi:phenylpropionate dioxygenase-like ring-hydroxylating dioxygenase large terminal subunit
MGMESLAHEHPTAVDYDALIERDRVHGSLYTSEEVFRDEMTKIFQRGWFFVGHESEVPNAGDFLTRTIGLEALVMVRDRNGEVRVFSNRCTHRGNKVCRVDHGNAKTFTCNYHGWSFSTEGDLLGIPYPGGFDKPKGDFALRGPAKVEAYRGFVFASFNPDAVSFETYLGNGARLIDQAVSLSPVGKIRLSAGWVKQEFRANWKLLPANDTDGYHANFVHASFLRVFRSQYDALLEKEEDRRSTVRDWGGGHSAIDASPMYERPFEWLGVSEDRLQDYVALMNEAYGESARQKLIAGPPHAIIFPNLFLAEMNVVMFQPISAGRSVQWHTPMLLDGVPDHLNTRFIRQSEGAMGPSAYLLADDAVISERQKLALQGRSGWLDLSRGMNREQAKDGVITSHISDETPNRAFWQHYKKVMQAQ